MNNEVTTVSELEESVKDTNTKMQNALKRYHASKVLNLISNLILFGFIIADLYLGVNKNMIAITVGILAVDTVWNYFLYDTKKKIELFVNAIEYGAYGKTCLKLAKDIEAKEE